MNTQVGTRVDEPKCLGGIILHSLLPFQVFLVPAQVPWEETREGSGAASGSQQRMAQGSRGWGDLQERVTGSRSSHCTWSWQQARPGRGSAGRIPDKEGCSEGWGARDPASALPALST